MFQRYSFNTSCLPKVTVNHRRTTPVIRGSPLCAISSYFKGYKCENIWLTSFRIQPCRQTHFYSVKSAPTSMDMSSLSKLYDPPSVPWMFDLNQ